MTEPVKALLEIAYFDDRPSRSEVPATARFDAQGLTLEIEGEGGGMETWRGERRGQGHYLLQAESPGRQASLHRFAESAILEGFWRDASERGFWRLHLPDMTPALLQARDPSPPPEVVRAAPRKAPRKRRRVAA